MTFDEGMAGKALRTMLESGILVEVSPGLFKLGEISTSTPATTEPEHNHFGEVLMLSGCPACARGGTEEGRR